ncbi:MAG: hypothetical protein V4820_01070 [Pseudomonadota bacterium]
MSFIEFLQPHRHDPEGLGDVFLDGADRYPKLRRCGFVTHAFKADEYESGSTAWGKLVQRVKRDGGFLLALKNPVGRELVKRVVDFLQLAMGAAAANRVAAVAIQQDVGRRLEDEAGKVRDLAAAAAIVESEEHLLNQVVDLVAVGAASKERA